jgi:hypothetical protein
MDSPCREGNRRIMIDPERDCRAGADKDQGEGANELGRQGPRNRLLLQSFPIPSKRCPGDGHRQRAD